MDALEQQKIQVMIELATNNLRTELESLRSEISGLKGEIGSVRQKAMSAPTMRPVMQDTNVEQKQIATPQAQAVRQSPTEPIDRNGVAPESVSIEKMFYCGNKRF